MKLENINIVLPEKIIFGNLETEKGLITKIKEISEENKECRRYVLPGLVDPHVHLRDPGLTHKEDVETGTKAAVNGGITTVFDMPNTNPPTTSIENFEAKKELYSKKANCKWKLFFGVTTKNSEEIEKLKKTKELAGLKLFMGSSTGNLLIEKDSYIKKALQLAAKKDLIVSIHAESEKHLKNIEKDYKGKQEEAQEHSLLRPAAAAIEAVDTIIKLCKETGAKINICHVSTLGELDLIETAKKDGLPITCEVTPHHLFLTTEAYQSLGNFIKANPPIREPQEMKGLWAHIQKGTIDMIATDHAPHTVEEKSQQFKKVPSGIPGLETTLPLTFISYHLGQLTLNQIAKLTSQNAAKIWDLNKGEIAKGKEADLTVIDFSQDWVVNNNELKTKCGWSPWNGLKVKGKLEQVYIYGKAILDKAN